MLNTVIIEATFGLQFTGVTNSMGTKISIDNVTIDSCGVGVYINNSQVAITNSTITNSHNGTTYGAGIVMTNSSAGQVLVDGCEIYDNGTGYTASSAGISLFNSHPEIINTKIYNNSGSGMLRITLTTIHLSRMATTFKGLFTKVW